MVLQNEPAADFPPYRVTPSALPSGYHCLRLSEAVTSYFSPPQACACVCVCVSTCVRVSMLLTSFFCFLAGDLCGEGAARALAGEGLAADLWGDG
jgi:hypothetical protein